MNTFLSDNGSVEECGGEYCLFSLHRERMGGEVGEGEVRKVEGRRGEELVNLPHRGWRIYPPQ